jgi:hypothetical protein
MTLGRVAEALPRAMISYLIQTCWRAKACNFLVLLLSCSVSGASPVLANVLLVTSTI